MLEMSLELLSGVRRATPPEAAAWKSYMPQRGNGGVPTQREVDRYVQDASVAPELRQKVLGELRERSATGPELVLTMMTTTLAIFAVLATIVAAFLSALATQNSALALDASTSFYLALGIPALGVFFLGTVLATAQRLRRNHATSWLAAYSEAETARKTLGSGVAAGLVVPPISPVRPAGADSDSTDLGSGCESIEAGDSAGQTHPVAMRTGS